MLLAHLLQLERIDLYLQYDRPVLGDELARFRTLIKRRTSREPTAYILGTKGFWSLDLLVTKAVLIPRPETECLVERALAVLSEEADADARPGVRRVLELGTGSGAIILALASQLPDSLFFASDASLPALDMAKENAKRLSLDDRICFLSADWLTSLKATRAAFDVIVSNPPYVRTADLQKLDPEIHGFEPHAALDGHEDGLFHLRQIIRSAHVHLRSGGHLLLEIGYDQKEAVRKIVHGCGFYEEPSFTKDYSGHDRVVEARKAAIVD